MIRALRRGLAVLELPAFRNAFVLRGLIVWAGLRVAVAAGLSVGPDPSFGVAGRAALVGIIALVVYLDARRRGETLFLANLGIPATLPVALSVVLPAILEIALP